MPRRSRLGVTRARGGPDTKYCVDTRLVRPKLYYIEIWARGGSHEKDKDIQKKEGREGEGLFFLMPVFLSAV